MPTLKKPALWIGSTALLLGVLCVHAPAGAEEKKKALPPHKLGPIHVSPQFRLVSGIDTNVFQTFDDPTRDAVMVLSPRLDGVLPVGRRLRLSGFGAVDLIYFRRQDDERSVDFQGEGKAELTLGRLLLFGGGGGGQFTQRFSIDVDDRLKRQEKHAYAGLTWRMSRTLSTTLQAGSEVVTFAPGTFRLGGDIKEAMDRNTRSATAQLRYAVTRRTTLVASAEALEDRFFSQPPTFPRERESRRYLGGFEFSDRALLNGRLLAGMRHFPGTIAEGTPNYRGPVVSADVILPVRNVVQFRVLADRDVLYAASLVEVQTLRYRNAFIYERVLGEAMFNLPLALLAIASGGFEEARYLLPLPYPDEFHLASREDHRWTAGLALYRRFGDSVRIGGHLFWARRVSNLATFSYEGTRYGLSAQFTP